VGQRTLTLRVRVEDLVAAVEKRRADIVAGHTRLVEQYPAQLEQWRTKTAAALRKVADDVEAGKDIELAGYSGPLRSLPAKPRKPEKRPETSAEDTILKALRLSTEPVIALRTDDALASYL
jgi:hypothetical protein